MQFRGQVSDVGGIILYVFVFLLLALFTSYIVTQLHTGFLNAYSEGNIAIPNGGLNSLNEIDSAASLPFALVPLVVILLAIASLVLAWYVPSNPAFLVIELVVLAVFEFIAAIFSNIMYAFISTPILAYIGNNNPYTVAIVVHFPLVIGIIAVLIIIVQAIRGSYPNVNPGPSGGGPLR